MMMVLSSLSQFLMMMNSVLGLCWVLLLCQVQDRQSHQMLVFESPDDGIKAQGEKRAKDGSAQGANAEGEVEAINAQNDTLKSKVEAPKMMRKKGGSRPL